MISHEHRCIFIHIPRTGGSSIESILWPMEERTQQHLWMGFTSAFGNKYQTGGLQHLLARQIREEVGHATFQQYFKFSFVRDPFDKAVSQYAYMKERSDLRAFIGMEANDSFDRYLELIGRKRHVQWQKQSDFLFDEGGACLVDFIGRFERFSEDTAALFQRLGVSATVPHVNSSARGPATGYYDGVARARVAALYADDFTAFNYSKE